MGVYLPKGELVASFFGDFFFFGSTHLRYSIFVLKVIGSLRTVFLFLKAQRRKRHSKYYLYRPYLSLYIGQPFNIKEHTTFINNK
jgi:hypothetical protein